jgi:hypothetical protein
MKSINKMSSQKRSKIKKIQNWVRVREHRGPFQSKCYNDKVPNELYGFFTLKNVVNKNMEKIGGKIFCIILIVSCSCRLICFQPFRNTADVWFAGQFLVCIMLICLVKVFISGNTWRTFSSCTSCLCWWSILVSFRLSVYFAHYLYFPQLAFNACRMHYIIQIRSGNETRVTDSSTLHRWIYRMWYAINIDISLSVNVGTKGKRSLTKYGNVCH